MSYVKKIADFNDDICKLDEIVNNLGEENYMSSILTNCGVTLLGSKIAILDINRTVYLPKLNKTSDFLNDLTDVMASNEIKEVYLFDSDKRIVTKCTIAPDRSYRIAISNQKEFIENYSSARERIRQVVQNM